MAEQASIGAPRAAASGVKPGLGCDSALHIAWGLWITMLAIPFVTFIVMIWALMGSSEGSGEPQGNTVLAHKWFIAAMAYMAICVPGAFFLRSRMFKGYWSGQIIAPREYLLGMSTIWAALELGGLFSLLGCIITNTLLPCLLPALLAFMLFTPLWPNGHSMTRPLYNEHDPADYEDPR